MGNSERLQKLSNVAACARLAKTATAAMNNANAVSADYLLAILASSALLEDLLSKLFFKATNCISSLLVHTFMSITEEMKETINHLFGIRSREIRARNPAHSPIVCW